MWRTIPQVQKNYQQAQKHSPTNNGVLQTDTIIVISLTHLENGRLCISIIHNNISADNGQNPTAIVRYKQCHLIPPSQINIVPPPQKKKLNIKFYYTVKCLNWWRTDYKPMLMTPHYWQLVVSPQTDLLLLPPLTGNWLGFRSGA